MIPLLIGVSPGRKITEKLPADELFITPVSSDGDEHDSDFVSRNKGDPMAENRNTFSNFGLQKKTVFPRKLNTNLLLSSALYADQLAKREKHKQQFVKRMALLERVHW